MWRCRVSVKSGPGHFVPNLLPPLKKEIWLLYLAIITWPVSYHWSYQIPSVVWRGGRSLKSGRYIIGIDQRFVSSSHYFVVKGNRNGILCMFSGTTGREFARYFLCQWIVLTMYYDFCYGIRIFKGRSKGSNFYITFSFSVNLLSEKSKSK